MFKISNWQRVGLAFSVAICILGIGATAVNWYYRNRIYPNIVVGRIDVGGQEIKESYKNLKDLAQEIESRKIQINHQSDPLYLSLSEMGIDLNVEETVQRAYRVKRNRPYPVLPWGMIERDTIAWEYNYDLVNIEKSIPETILKSLAPSQDATLNLKSEKIEIIPDVEGVSINFNDLAEQAVKLVTEKDDLVMELPIIFTEADITEKDLQAMLPTIVSLTEPHTITFNEKAWSLSRNEILQWIQIISENKVDLNGGKIQAFLMSLSEEVAQSPVSAQLSFNPELGEVFVSKASISGYQLDIDASAKNIMNNILDLQSKSTLIAIETKPEIYEDNIESLGITELLGSGTSNFAGSPPNRIHNIKVNAERTSGTLLAPSEEFSFVSKMGPVNANTGYLPELVIKGDRTIPEYGGGICQVSSTLFRATLNTTLPITERQAHSYVVSYYGTPGLDATIYTPRPDFKFQNNTNGHILMQHKIEGTKITYEIYGTKPDTEARVIGPIVLSASPDGSMRTVVHREIYQDGEKIDTNSFYSNYRPPNTVTNNPLE